MADCYQAANDLPRAAEFYQRVYYQYLTGDAANLAAAALVALRDAMGAAYPQPSPQLMLRRADKLMEIHEYAKARAEYAGPLVPAPGPGRPKRRAYASARRIISRAKPRWRPHICETWN